MRNQRLLTVSCMVIFLLFSLFSTIEALPSAYTEASPRTVYVNASNLGDPNEDGSYEHPFDQIQEGVNASSFGDTVSVASGVYYEEVSLSENKSGISLVGEKGATIDGERRRNGMRIGVRLTIPDYLYNVSVTGFTVRNCVKGITLMRSRYARLRNNTMVGNTYNFADYSLQVNDVDTSNTVDGRPIYYWVNEYDRQIPSDAGFVGLVNSRGITVRDLNLTSNGQGILLKNTTSSVVENVSFVNNQDGIYLDHYCTNNTVTGNSAVNNAMTGVYLSTSSGNILGNNRIAGNQYGVYLTTSSDECSENLIVNNTIEGHWKGIVLQGEANLPASGNILKNNILLNNSIAISMSLSISNLIYHNNLVSNADQIESSESQNTFDHLGEGNFWSDYNGSDTNNDGIGDTSYVINDENRDNFPLMGPFQSFNIVWEAATYTLDIVASSAVSDLNFSQAEKSITFFLEKNNSPAGFCRITIPKILLGGPYQVQADRLQTIASNEESNSTHSFLFFMYPGDGNRIDIVGNTVVPEFLPVLLMLSLLIATVLVFFLRKRHTPEVHHHLRLRQQCTLRLETRQVFNWQTAFE